MFIESMKELKNIRCIVVTGMLIACYVVLKNYLGINTPILKINLAFIPLAVIGMFFGPFVSLIAGAACDLIAGFTGPFAGSLNPFFTLIEMFFGLVYGIFLYRYNLKNPHFIDSKLKLGVRLKEMGLWILRWWRIIAAHAIVVFIGRMIFTTTVIHFATTASDRDFYPLFILRLTKNLIEFPIAIILIFAVLIPLKTAYEKVMLKGKA